METRCGIAAVGLSGSLALAAPALAAGKGQRVQTQTKQQSKAGSSTQKSTMGAKTQAGKNYGPGDGTANHGVGPEDRTGYGAPGNW